MTRSRVHIGRTLLASSFVSAIVGVGATASSPSAVALAPSTVFSYTGASQTYTVPPNVTSITVDSYGAQGGTSDESACESGGFGGRVTGTIAVVPGETLLVFVGGAGGRYAGPGPQSGGFNGGGNGRFDTVGGSRGGGGASDVRRAPYGLTDRLIVAGGGGGAGNSTLTSSGGAGGGSTGGAGVAAPNAGTGGTSGAGGAAGTTVAPAIVEATAGTLGQGGDGGYSSGIGAFTGGGGGGGYYGGGGAGGKTTLPGAGGGGGSGFGPSNAVMQSGVRGRAGDCSAPELGPLPGMVVITSPDSLGTYHALEPARLFDTRDTARVADRATLAFTVLGAKGVPSTGVDAVVMNVTVTQPAGDGYLTVFPCGSSPPLVSNLNYVSGLTVANLVTVKVGAAGQVCFYSSIATHVIADVSGYFTATNQTPGGRFTPLTPARLLDTRDFNKLNGGVVLPLTVLGQKGVPATGVSAVVLNVTATEPEGSGYLTVFPCGSALPLVSNLNYTAGKTVPNLVVVKVGAGGQVCFYSQVRTQVVADVSGYFGVDGAVDGNIFNSLPPMRILDTREGVGAPKQPVAANSTIALSVLGAGGIPASGVTAVVLNVTVDQTRGDGYLTVYPCGQLRPLASNLNYVIGQIVPNLVVVALGASGQVCLYTQSQVQMIADVSGWYGP